MKVKINNKEYELKYGMGIYLFFESVMGESFNFENMGSYRAIINLFYSTILSTLQYNEENLTYKYRDFINYIDENGGPVLLNEFAEWFMNNIDVNNSVTPQEEATTDEDKPKRKKKRKQ